MPPDLATLAFPHNLTTAEGRAAATLDVAQAVMPGLRIASAEFHREHLGAWTGGQWCLRATLEDGTREWRLLHSVRVDASRSDKLPDGSLVCYATAIGEAWNALVGVRRGAA